MAEKTRVVPYGAVLLAQLRMKLDVRFGREHEPAVVAIANAKRQVREFEDGRWEVEYVVTIPQAPLAHEGSGL